MSVEVERRADVGVAEASLQLERMAGLSMSYTLHALREASDEELIERHDRLAVDTQVEVSYYLEELARRDA